jgi:predicted flavoprotein YhiN
VTANALAKSLSAPRGKQSFSNILRKAAGLSPVAIGLVNEATKGGASRMPPDDLAELIKVLPLQLTGIAPIDKAISTAGGISFAELDENFMLRTMPGVFAAGEMLDWEAPTGGYLLQACFATGAAAGRGALRFLAERRA